jgi:hypothetical protein
MSDHHKHYDFGRRTATIAGRITRIGLEAAAIPASALPEEVRSRLHHKASGALHTLSVGPRILGGVLEEMARQVDAAGSAGRGEAGDRDRDGTPFGADEGPWPEEEEPRK